MFYTDDIPSVCLSVYSGGLLAEFSGENFLESQSFYVSFESSINKVLF